MELGKLETTQAIVELKQHRTFTVHHGRRYRAVLTLGWLEQFATNRMVAEGFMHAGFADVAVTGIGEHRIVEGCWSGPDTTDKIDPHLSSVEEIAPTC